MFAELLLPLGMSTDRDEVADAIADAFADQLEMSGAGSGVYGSNLDLELIADLDPDELIVGVRRTLASLGVIGGKLRIEGSDAWTEV